MAQSLRELQTKRAHVVADMRRLVARADAAGRDLTRNEDAKWRRLDAVAVDLKDRILVARVYQKRTVKPSAPVDERERARLKLELARRIR